MNNFEANTKVLFVDDEPEILSAFVSLMRKENVKALTLNDSSKIEETLEELGPFAVVLSDQRMPNKDGVFVLKKVLEKSPGTVRIMVTGYSDHSDTIRAINEGGIDSYIAKPWDDERLKEQLRNWVGQFNLKAHNKYLMRLLDDENKKLSELLDGTVGETVKILGDLANHISPKIVDLRSKVKTLGNTVLEIMSDIPSEEKWAINRAMDLFTLGIALLPPSIQAGVAKEGLQRLNLSSIARNHHLLAAGLLKKIPRFEPVAEIIEFQAKDFNGKGEPADKDVSGEDIPFGARLLHILIDLVKPSSSILRGTKLLQHMDRMTSKYDTNIIKTILGHNVKTSFLIHEEDLTVDRLVPGMVLVNEVRSISGQLLLKANVTLTDTFINILEQWHKREPIEEPIKVKYVL